MNDSVDPAARSVDRCPHRKQVSDSTCGDAVCLLIHQLSLPVPKNRASVPRDVCSACVRSFEPTLSDPNPVIASLVYSITDEHLKTVAKGTPQFEQLVERRDFAESNLPQVLPHESDIESTEVDVNRKPLSLQQLNSILPVADRFGSPPHRWAVGLTTAPRRHPTLAKSVDGLFRCGWEQLHLFVDGDVPLPEPIRNRMQEGAIETTIRSRPAGAWQNFLLGLSELVECQPDADAYLMVQDDVLWPNAPQLSQYLAEMLWPSAAKGIVSLYTSVDDESPQDGWSIHPDRWKYGALAFIFPRTIARRLTSDPWIRRHGWGGPVSSSDRAGVAGVDSAIGHWAVRRGISIWHPTPSVVQHFGHVSAIWKSARAVGLRRAGRWLGSVE